MPDIVANVIIPRREITAVVNQRRVTVTVRGKTSPILSLALISRYSQFIAGSGSFPDLRGDSLRTVYPLQHILGDGVGYLAHADLTGTETVVSKNGSAAVAVAAGKVTIGVGTLWSFVLSNGSTYEFATLTGAASAVCYDTSGNGRHLILTGFADVPGACVESMSVGSDWLNQKGWTEADGATQYMSAISFGLIPAGVIIPALADGSGCCAYEVIV